MISSTRGEFSIACEQQQLTKYIVIDNGNYGGLRITNGGFGRFSYIYGSIRKS
jgi:hypothetical protein